MVFPASEGMVRVCSHMIVMIPCHMVVVVTLGMGMVDAVTSMPMLGAVGVVMPASHRMVFLDRMVMVALCMVVVVSLNMSMGCTVGITIQ